MKLLLYMLLSITCVSCFHINVNESSKEKIVGGVPPEANDADFVAILYFVGELLCGASIIGRDWLMSGEICMLRVSEPHKNLKARAGKKYHVHGPMNDFLDVAYVIVYSDTVGQSDPNTNPALVKLAESLIFDGTKSPIAISHSGDDPSAGVPMKILGFGKLHPSHSEMSNWLHEATVIVLKRNQCPTSSAKLFCALGSHRDACFGDEGGPALIEGKLFAIITGFPNCGNGNPGIYTKVGPYHSWVVEKTGLQI